MVLRDAKPMWVPDGQLLASRDEELVRASPTLERRRRTRLTLVKGSMVAVGAMAAVSLAVVVSSMTRNSGGESQIEASGAPAEAGPADPSDASAPVEEESGRDHDVLPGSDVRRFDTELADLIKPPTFSTGSSILTVDTANGVGEVRMERTALADASTGVFATGIRGRSNPAVVWTGDELLIVGGRLPGSVDEPFGLIVDPETFDAQPIAEPPQALDSFSLAKDRGVWVSGRLIFWQEELAYEPSTGLWHTIPPPPFEDHRDFASTVVVRDQVVVFGGCSRDVSQDPKYSSNCMETGLSPQSTGAIYDPASGQWRAIQSGPAFIGGAHHEAVAHGGKLFVLNLEGQSSHFASYDLAAATWRELAGPPLQPRVHSAVAVEGDSLVVWGGLLARDVPDPNPGLVSPTRDSLLDGAVYALADDSWSGFSLPDGVQRSHHSLVGVGNGTAFISGSYQNNDPLLVDVG